MELRIKLRRRRSPREAYGLWGVIVPDVGPLGYLVMKPCGKTPGGYGKPVGFVLGTSKTSLRAALRIYATAAKRRAIGWRQFIGLVLVPVDSLGRRIRKRRQFITSAIYMAEQYLALNVGRLTDAGVTGRWAGGAA